MINKQKITKSSQHYHRLHNYTVSYTFIQSDDYLTAIVAKFDFIVAKM